MKLHRLTDRERFRQVRQEGVSYAHPLLILCVLPNDQPISRCGFTASRRIGQAVERNRARRRMREAVRLAGDLVMPGWDMVWIARPRIVNSEFAELQDACLRLLRRAKALKLWPETETEGGPITAGATHTIPEMPQTGVS